VAHRGLWPQPTGLRLERECFRVKSRENRTMGEKKMIFTLNVDGYAKAWPYVQALILSEASYLAPVKQAAARLFNITLAI